MGRRLKSKHKPMNQSSISPIAAYGDQVQLWAIRVLMGLKAYRRVGHGFFIDAGAVCEFLHLKPAFSDKVEQRVTPGMLLVRRTVLEESISAASGPLASNLRSLAMALGLSPA